MVDTLKLRILLLDDEPFMLKLAGQMLANLGFTSVIACDNARTALAALEGPAGAPDVILLDLNMPDMDGVQFARELRARRYAGGVILVSGEDEQLIESVEVLLRAQQIHVIGHLRKPLQPEALLALVRAEMPAIKERTLKVRTTYGPDDLRAAIEQGQLVNHYQPQVRVTDGSLTAVEALVRWSHPDDGLVFPDRFIGVAEANGLIGDLTDVVLRAALEQAARWQAAGRALAVAVNLSVDSLASLDFPDVLAALAASAGVPHHQVVLEVTESRLSERLGPTLDVLTRLRLKRFRLSIDDFGTGYSSLAQLRDMPFDELKIDRGFVHGATSSAKRRAIYEASLSLARQLDLAVVAEGVEDLDDWRLLRGTGCEFAQGYFIGRPMPAGELQRWLANWQQRLADEPLLEA